MWIVCKILDSHLLQICLALLEFNYFLLQYLP